MYDVGYFVFVSIHDGFLSVSVILFYIIKFSASLASIMKHFGFVKDLFHFLLLQFVWFRAVASFNEVLKFVFKLMQ